MGKGEALSSQKPSVRRKFCENGWMEVMYDVPALTYVVLCMAKKRVSEDKNVPQTIWRYKRGVAQTDVVTKGFDYSFENKNRSCDLRNILETGSGEL